MRRILVALALIVISLGVASSGAPQIAVDVALYTYPDVVAGLAVAHTFVLSNIGDQELVIETAGPSCSCTKITTELQANRVQPGQSVELYALLDTNGISGRDPKQIKVVTNDPTRQPPNELLLTMVGNVTERAPHQTSVGELLYSFYLLLDVREPAAYVSGRLVGAMNFPASQAASLAYSLPPNVLTIFYDQSGEPSILSGVTEALHRAGVADAYALTGGLAQWQESYGSTRMTSGADASWGLFLDVSGPRDDSSGGTMAKYYIGWLRTDYILIDIRSAAAFADGHLAGAVNLSEADLATYIDALPHEMPIIVYSDDGVAGERAAYDLWTRGSQVQSLLGGLAEWETLHGNMLIVASAG